MRKSREFDNVLEECIERLIVQGETVEQCLQSYPKYADELKPLLETALSAKGATNIQPRPEFRDRARYQFHTALQEMELKKSRPFFSWQPRLVATVAIVLVLLVIGGSTVVAASGSMPGEPLYPVKLATERVHLWLTPSSLGKAELYAKLADKRVVEMVNIAGEDKSEQIELTAQRLDDYLTKIADLASTQPVAAEAVMAPGSGKAPLTEEALETDERAVSTPEAIKPPTLSERAVEDETADFRLDRRSRLKMIVIRYAINHPARLRALLETVSPSTRAALLEAINLSEAGYEKAIRSLD